MRYLLSIALVFMLTGAAGPQTSAVGEIKWLDGPCSGRLGDIASIQVPEGYSFVGAKDSRILMEEMQNPVTGLELGLITSDSSSWYILFEFEDVGYIRDDEKNSLDAYSMLESIKAGTQEANKERTKRGWATLNILGWEQRPHYDETTHNLEWAIRGESQGLLVINYHTRFLGRKGVMSVTLVSSPLILESALPDFKSILNGFEFNRGNSYAEFREGDKVAKYGLSALVVGGAAAVAAKSGIFKWLWKAIVMAFLAAAGFLKKLFGRKKAEPAARANTGSPDSQSGSSHT